MRELNRRELAQVSGRGLECSLGVPSGVSCKGSPADFRDAGIRLWAFSAMNPISGPGIMMRVYKRLG